MNQIPCKHCSHIEQAHTSGYCFKCLEGDKLPQNNGLKLFGIYFSIAKHNFVPDNLKYLEQKYNEQILEEFKK